MKKFAKKALLLVVSTLMILNLCSGMTFAEGSPTMEAIKGTPTVDGVVDTTWEKAVSVAVQEFKTGNAANNATGTVKAMWDSANLYLLCEVKDNVVAANSTSSAWFNDSFEFMVDEGLERLTSWDSNDGKFRVDVNNVITFHTKGGGYNNRTITSAVKKTADGYVIEVAWPWVVQKDKVAIGSQIGINFEINDDSTGAGTRTGEVWWTGSTLPSDMKAWGVLTMGAAPATPTPTPAPTPIPATPTPSPTPAGTYIPIDTYYDAEALTIAASSGKESPIKGRNDARGGNMLAYYPVVAGEDYITLNVDVTKTGLCDIILRANRWTNRPIIKLSIDGVDVGTTQDLYGTEELTEINFGKYNFTTTGTKTFKITYMGRNTASTGDLIQIDYILLRNYANVNTLSPLSFKDVKTTDWFYNNTRLLVYNNIIAGYPDGTFKPSGSVNVDAFIKMVITALGHTDVTNSEGYWATNYFSKASSLGLTKFGEFTDKDYTRAITRGEMARIITRALTYRDEKFETDLSGYISSIKDYSKLTVGFEDSVLKAVSKGIITGYPDGEFKDTKNATRAEAATMIARLIDLNQRQQVKK